MKRQRTINVDAARLVYICHPLGCDIPGNVEHVTIICGRILEAVLEAKLATRPITFPSTGELESIAYVPMAPHLLLPTFLDDTKVDERNLAMDWCLAMLDRCDEIWVIGKHVSTGMQEEIERALDREKVIRWLDARDFGLKEVPL